MVLSYIIQKDAQFDTIHEVLDLDIAKSVIEVLQQANVTNIIAEVQDHVFINNEDPRLFEGFSMGNPKIKRVIY